MAIKVIYGPGGSGKSFFQMSIVVDQLRDTRRNICTNLAIDIPKLQAWLERKYPNECIDAGRRIRILTVAETREFWKHRGPWRWYGKTGFEYDLEVDESEFGVCYIIDEAGAAGFGAIGWAASEGRSTRGDACFAYLDQQRKFGDDVFMSCNGRTPVAIAKPFRDKAHGFIKLRNEYLATYGPFKGRGRFVWRLYETEPNGQKIEHIQQGTFSFGSGLEDCYRTGDGIGVTGGKADIGARAKGIPIMWVIPGALALCSLCFLIPWGLGQLASKAIKSTSEHRAPEAHLSTSPTPALSPTPPSPSSRDGKGVGYLRTSAGVSLVAYSVIGKSVRVELSDGRVFDETSPDLVEIGRDYVDLGGERLYFRAPQSTSVTPAPAEQDPPSGVAAGEKSA